MESIIGISYCIQEVVDADEYIRNANLAMYQAKAKGGGRAEVFSQTKGLKIKNKVILEAAVREAVRNKSFHLNFQPIYNLDSLSIVGLEVLLQQKELKRRNNYGVYVTPNVGMGREISFLLHCLKINSLI